MNEADGPIGATIRPQDMQGGLRATCDAYVEEYVAYYGLIRLNTLRYRDMMRFCRRVAVDYENGFASLGAVRLAENIERELQRRLTERKRVGGAS